MSWLRVCSTVALCSLVGLIVSGALSFSLRAESAGSGTLRIDPPSSGVAVGSSITLNVMQSAGVDISGVQTDVVFPPAELRLQSVIAGVPYADAGATLVAGDQQTLQHAIDESNITGTLRNLAVFFSPGSGTVPAGDQVAFALVFSGSSDGKPTVDLTEADMLDATGLELSVTTTGGTVTVGNGDATPTAVDTATPTSSPSAVDTVAATDTPVPADTAESTSSPTPTTAPCSATIRPVPDTLSVTTEFTVNINITANCDTRSAQTSVVFDQNVLHLADVVFGPAFAQTGAQQLIGGNDATPDNIAAAIADANASGTLESVNALYTTKVVFAGENTFLMLKFTPIHLSDSSAITLAQTEVLDTSLEQLPVAAEAGHYTVTGTVNVATRTPMAANSPQATSTGTATATRTATKTATATQTASQATATTTGTPPTTSTAQATVTTTPAATGTPAMPAVTTSAAATSRISTSGTPRPATTSRSSSTLGATSARASALPRGGTGSRTARALWWIQVATALGAVGFGLLSFELRRRGHRSAD